MSVSQTQFEGVLDHYAKMDKHWELMTRHIKHLNVLIETWHNAIRLSWWERFWQTDKAKQIASALAEGATDADMFCCEIDSLYPQLAKPLGSIVARNKALLKERFNWYKVG